MGRNIDDYVEQWYRKETFLKAYGHFLIPINGENNWAMTPFEQLKPPIIHRMPGRPRVERRDKDEEPKKRKQDTKLPRLGREITCGKFGDTEHNVVHCKVHGPAPPPRKTRIFASSQPPTERVYTKHRSHGLRKVSQNVGQRRPGRPRKQKVQLDGFGVYTNPNTGETYYRTPGASQTVHVGSQFQAHMRETSQAQAATQSTQPS